ncbi:MAG: helix-turn-helix domain-containing protein [Bacteroidota bacterium]
MNYELKDNLLNGHLRLSNGFSKSTKQILTCYTFIWNRGAAKHWEIDLIPITFDTNTIFSLSPGQTLHIIDPMHDCIVIQFNREFYCVQDHDKEVSCNGILFNGALSTPMIKLDQSEQRSFDILLEIIREEFANRDEIQLEMLRTVLKRFIIKCTRLAKLQFAGALVDGHDLDVVRNFSALVEKHFRTMHMVSDYAELMNKSPKTLSNVFNTLGQKTPLQIIHERVILEAKKLLLYTDKTAKEISFELNFSDPVQFSRLFKNATGQTPVEFKKLGIGASV